MSITNKVAKAIFEADYPNDKWERFKEGDVVNVRYLRMATAAIMAMDLPPMSGREKAEIA